MLMRSPMLPATSAICAWSDRVTTPRVKGTPIELGGETFVIPPLSLASIENHGDQIASSKLMAADPSAMMNKGTIGLVIDLAFESLQRNYPDLTRAQVADMIDISNMQAVFEAIMMISVPKPEPGEAPAKGE